MSFEGGYQSDIILLGNSAKGGAIFITNIAPQNPDDTVSLKTYSSDGFTLQSCTSSSDLIIVSVLAITGYSSFQPTVTVENEVVSLIQDEDQNIWTGSIALTIENVSAIEAVHSDGASQSCLINRIEKPIITSAIFSGDYPANQSELKEGDFFEVTVRGSELFNSIDVDNYGAAKAATKVFTETLETTFFIEVANQGEFTQSYGVKLRIVNSNGVKSDWFLTDSSGTTDKVNTVLLNNKFPIISIQEIQYPPNQKALKNNETASVKIIADNYDSIQYGSENDQLSIELPSVFEEFKAVSRISGAYNVSTDNLSVVVTRQANGASSQANAVIKIANSPAQLSFIEPTQRFNSGGNNGTEIQKHQLLVNSSQQLVQLPLLNAPQGTLDNDGKLSENKKQFSQSLLVHDDDTRGINSIELVEAVNLAGLVSTSFIGKTDYEIGGFVKRSLLFPEFGNEAALGVQVSDWKKLTARDKDGIAMTFVPELTVTILGYSITQPSDTVNDKGNTFHWLDQQAIDNNSTGLAFIEVEETP